MNPSDYSVATITLCYVYVVSLNYQGSQEDQQYC